MLHPLGEVAKRYSVAAPGTNSSADGVEASPHVGVG